MKATTKKLYYIRSREMTTEGIQQNTMQSIAKVKYKDYPNEETMKQIVNKIKTNIPAKKPFIFLYSDFDKIEFYKNIIQIGAYYLINFDIATFLDKFLLKNLIDITNIIKCILNEDNEDAKFYLYHSINVFSRISNEIEKSSKFLKIGIRKLKDRYNIQNFIEFFPEGEK